LIFAEGGRVLIIDADLQDPPELLGDMMKLMDEGAEVVYGKRTSRRSESFFKRTTAYGFYRVLNYLSDVEIPTDTGDFRLMSRKALDALNSMPETYRYIRGMVAWLGFKQVPIKYSRMERVAGKSKYPLLSMLRFAANAVTSFSIRPLRLAVYLGLVTALFLLVAIAYVIVSYFEYQTVQGWSSLMVVVLFLSAVQLFSIGIIGEYLGRMFIEQKRRPLFIVSEIVANAKLEMDGKS